MVCRTRNGGSATPIFLKFIGGGRAASHFHLQYGNNLLKQSKAGGRNALCSEADDVILCVPCAVVELLSS